MHKNTNPLKISIQCLMVVKNMIFNSTKISVMFFLSFDDIDYKYDIITIIQIKILDSGLILF